MEDTDAGTEDNHSCEEKADSLFESLADELARLRVADRPQERVCSDLFDYTRRDYAILVNARSPLCVSIDAQSEGASEAVKSLFGTFRPAGVFVGHQNGVRWFSCAFHEECYRHDAYSHLLVNCNSDAENVIFMNSRESVHRGGVQHSTEIKTRLLFNRVYATSLQDAIGCARAR